MAHVFELFVAERVELEHLVVNYSEGTDPAQCLARVWEIYLNFRNRIPNEPCAVNKLDMEFLRDLRHIFEPLVTFH